MTGVKCVTRVTVLGCGASGGVPRIGPDWGTCDPSEPKNRRLRSSIVVEQGETRVLVDTTPDLRQQLLTNDISEFDAVLYTHAHADHSHGIDDMRTLFRINRHAYPVHASAATFKMLKRNFAYAFAAEDKLYAPFFVDHELNGRFQVGDMEILPYEQDHGHMPSTGYRIGNVAYSTDLIDLPLQSLETLVGIDTLIVQALRPAPHPTHAHLDLSLEWIAKIQPRRAILTHMNHEMDYDTLCQELPEGVEPAYDGMVIEVP
jgi:phosphoribosyl 1,2-cyclic phosphate phosphodiesterase